MTLKELRELIDLVYSRESIEEFEVERSGVRMRIKRTSPYHAPQPHSSSPHLADLVAPRLAAIAPQQGPASPGASQDSAFITAPILGTFYVAPSPEAAPFVKVGDHVEKGTIVCIIEAMKLMNEIESDVSGEITKVFVKNGQPVEFGERLFEVKTA